MMAGLYLPAPEVPWGFHMRAPIFPKFWASSCVANTGIGGEHFLNIYYSFTIGMLKRLARGGYRLAVNPSKR
jgi:hypothetical protein